MLPDRGSCAVPWTPTHLPNLSMATKMLNGGSGADGKNPSMTLPSMGKQQVSKSTATAGKTVDTASGKKQASNSSDGTQR